MKIKIHEVLKPIEFHILKSHPPQLLIVALGLIRTSGWTAGELVPKFTRDGIRKGKYEFDFLAEPPSGIALEVISKIQGQFIFDEIPILMKEVIIRAETNEVTHNYSISSKEMLSTKASSKKSATGYSNKLFFDEAFQDALKKLPLDDGGVRDGMLSVKVIEIGGNFGGIAGLHRMYVKIEA